MSISVEVLNESVVSLLILSYIFKSQPSILLCDSFKISMEAGSSAEVVIVGSCVQDLVR